MIGFIPSRALKKCVYCMPFSSQSALCVCVRVWAGSCLCVVCCNLHSFFQGFVLFSLRV